MSATAVGYSEEGTRFIDLALSVPPAEQAMIQQRYAKEYDRYLGGRTA